MSQEPLKPLSAEEIEFLNTEFLTWEEPLVGARDWLARAMETVRLLNERQARLVEALKPFAECNREWMEHGKRAEIRFDWLGAADEILREIEQERVSSGE